MTLLEYLLWGLGIIFVLYVAARVISAAIFRSKEDHDLRSRNHDRSSIKP